MRVLLVFVLLLASGCQRYTFHTGEGQGLRLDTWTGDVQRLILRDGETEFRLTAPMLEERKPK